MNAIRTFALSSLIILSLSATARSKETADTLSRELQEVVVTARQPATKLVGSTLISTIAGSNLADLGNALDVLAQLPLIKVEDNTVSVIGKSDIEIFIDGRPMRDEFELQQLLSSNIKTVELLMAPGAAYESTTGAVLLITTKRNFAKGISLTDQFQVQRRRRWSVMDHLSIVYRFGKWELFANGTINHDNSLAKGETTNTLIYDEKPATIGATQHNAYPTTTGVVKAGFNYAEDNQSFGAYYRYNPEHGNFLNTGSEWLDNDPVLSREIEKHIRSRSHLASAYYENRFADKFLLHFDGDFRQSKSQDFISTTYPESDNAEVRSSDLCKSTLWAGKLYLNFPLWSGNFTVGSQDSYTCTSLDYRMLNAQVEEYIPSSFTDARQTSAALFASWAKEIGRFSLSAGLRYEYVDYDFKTDGRRDEDMSRRHHLLTPDISLGYTFNFNSQLNLSYKMATVKPPYSQLTGSLNYVGVHEIEGGNPALRDEHMHDLQLLGTWRDFILQGNFIRSLDSYAFVKQLYPAQNLQLLMHPVNINVSAVSAYLLWSKPVGCWTPDVTVGVYRQWLTLDCTKHNKPLFSYYFDNTFTLPKGWMITANVSGRSEGDMHTNRFGATWFTMDASIGRTLLNKSVTIKLTVTDIFNTANHDWTMSTFGIFVSKRQSYDRRGIALNIIYNFQPRKSAYKGSPASESELRRL